eukprot:2825496-Prymnesium_polylepis.1
MRARSSRKCSATGKFVAAGTLRCAPAPSASLPNHSRSAGVSRVADMTTALRSGRCGSRRRTCARSKSTWTPAYYGPTMPNMVPNMVPNTGGGHLREEQVDVGVALVSLVDHNARGAREERVAAQPPEQHARRDELDRGVRARRAPLEVDCVSDAPSDALTALARDATRDGDGGEAARLRDDDPRADPAVRERVVEQELGHLRRLARAGAALDQRELRSAQPRDQVVSQRADWQLARDARLGAHELGKVRRRVGG